MCGFVGAVLVGGWVCLVRVFRGVCTRLHRRGERVLNAHPSGCLCSDSRPLFCDAVHVELLLLVLALACSLADCLSRSGGLCGGHGGSTHVSVCEARTLQGVYADPNVR